MKRTSKFVTEIYTSLKRQKLVNAVIAAIDVLYFSSSLLYFALLGSYFKTRVDTTFKCS